MKYARSITVISLLFLAFRSFACYIPSYQPSEYYLFYIEKRENHLPATFNLNSKENCLLWQQQTSRNIPLEDIYQLVYKVDLEVLTQLNSHKIPQELKDNKMAQWLVLSNDQETLDFLLLAKNCEWLRRECLSPWYYPSKNDPVKYSLNDVGEIARQRAQGRFADRYALQAVRAMTTLRQYEEIIRFWQDTESNIPEGLIRQMAQSYVAGAHHHLGNLDEAKRHYILANDMEGLLYCDSRYHWNSNPVERMGLLYELYPDYPEFHQLLWDILGKIEPDRDWNSDWGWQDHKKIEIIQLGMLCDRILSENSNADKALWAYAATYIAHLKGNDNKADRYLKIAEQTVKDQPLSDAIRVMRIFIDAQILPYNTNYEQKLFSQMRWLQSMIETHIDDETQYITNDFYNLKDCRSYYYWNDAMRCILLGTVCPKMLKAGKSTLALQLANMADYTLINRINSVSLTLWDQKAIKKYGGSHVTLSLNQYRHSGLFNNYDYSSHFASMMDNLPAKALMNYADIALKPQTEFQRFLNMHSYIDMDFLYEIIGTHYLREMCYDKAVASFSKVSTRHFIQTNVYKEGLLHRDPFQIRCSKWNHSADAKRHFAQIMSQLEHDINNTNDPNEKAWLMIKFGIGLRNSFDYCWALTHYQHGWVWSAMDEINWQNDSYTQKALQKANAMFTRALAMFTDEENVANAHLLFCNYKTVKERYPNSQTAMSLQGRCDKYLDYHSERKQFTYFK